MSDPERIRRFLEQDIAAQMEGAALQGAVFDEEGRPYGAQCPRFLEGCEGCCGGCGQQDACPRRDK